MQPQICLNNHSSPTINNKNNEHLSSHFTDTPDHIKFMVSEVNLWLAAAYLNLKGIELIDAKNSALDILKLPDRITSRTELENEIISTWTLGRNMEAASLQKGISLKFTELVNIYQLDRFERKILQVVLAADTSLDMKIFFDQCDIEFWSNGFNRGMMELGVLLSIVCRNYHEQLAGRRAFSIERPLVKNEIITLSSRYFRFLESDVEIHERISRFCLDDHNVYDTAFSCISSESPRITLDQIIFDEAIKNDLVQYAESFLAETKHSGQLNHSFGYGTGLTCLFYGLSGTGKTMLAHGLANHLGCQLFSVNIDNLDNEEVSFEDAIKHIFREARLSGGIVFLDECDDLLTENTRMSRTFLIEIEKANCITILATNKTITMDPALDRRIILKIHFELPEAGQRMAIWKALLPDGMRYGDCVNLQGLAEMYQFTGGLIKNSILIAAGKAFSQKKEKNDTAVIKADEIHKAAQHQAKSMFDLGGVGEVLISNVAFDQLDLRTTDKDKFQRAARTWPKIASQGKGFCGLICSHDLATAIQSTAALANSLALPVRQISLSTLLYDAGSVSPENPIRDPTTQKVITSLDFIFTSRPCQQEILLILDVSQDLKDLIAGNTENNLWPNWEKLKQRMRTFKGILFLVSAPVALDRIPIEFGFHIFLEYPCEELQIQAWKRSLPHLQDDDVVDIVEQFPMYLQEIDLVARQAELSNIVDGLPLPGKEEVSAMAGRLRKTKKMPVLFGRRQ